MTQGFEKRKHEVDDEEENNNKRPRLNEDDTIDPALFRARDSPILRSQPSGVSQGMALGYLGRVPTSRTEARRVGNLLRQQETLRGISAYTDPGSNDPGRSSREVTGLSTVPEPRAAPSILPSQLEVDASTSNKASERVTRSSKKRNRADAGSDSENESDLEDTKVDSRRSTKRSKHAKVPPEHNDDASDDGDRRKRKISKLNAKIAAGKGPQKGSLGPAGEVRTRKDGRMEFRDVNNPEWTLAAYHNSYRRHFLNEAAQDGDFNHTPTRGEAANDETSFQAEQQNWGPERADWQNMVNSEGVKVMFEVDPPRSIRPPREPSNWVHDGLVLLDSKNHPVKDWPELNKTLSSAVEGWRWEALIRMYPYLTVTDLFARLPHTRMHKGKVLPLQTPQAFTNRTYRLRRANQIPASKMKNGSATYKTDILKNLAEMGARTTEALPILNPNQIEEARKANKGKFKRNSRYVVKNEGSGGSPPPPRKRKARYAEETDSELEQEKPKAKKPYVGAASAVAGGLTPGQFYENTVENTGFNGGHYFNAPTDAPGPWHGQEQDVYATETTNLGAEESAEDLVPLFDTIGDQGLALLMDSTFTSPSAVIRARRHGHRNTDYVGVHYYTQRTPRYVDENGVIVGDVVHEAFSGQWKASEPTLGHAQSLSSHFDNTGSVGTPLLPRGMQPPNDIPLTPVTGMYAPGHSSYPHTLTQTPTYPQVTRGMGYYAPSQVYPNVPRQNPYYPSVATGMNPYVPDHGVYPDVPGQTPLYPSVTRGMGSYAPSHSFYPNVPGPAPSYPSVTPVTNLQAPLQFQNHLGRFEDEEEAAEEGFGRRRQRR